MRRSIALLALLLAGCEPGAQTSGGTVPVPSEFAGWRMLSTDGPRAQSKPSPRGFAQVRRLGDQGDFPNKADLGVFYIVFDAGYRPVGHVTNHGHAVRYAPPGRGPDQSLGEGPVLEQMACLLTTTSELHVYSLDGKPRDLP